MRMMIVGPGNGGHREEHGLLVELYLGSGIVGLVSGVVPSKASWIDFKEGRVLS